MYSRTFISTIFIYENIIPGSLSSISELQKFANTSVSFFSSFVVSNKNKLHSLKLFNISLIEPDLEVFNTDVSIEYFGIPIKYNNNIIYYKISYCFYYSPL